MFTPQFLIHAELLRETVPGFDAYPFSLPIVRSLDLLPFHPAVTFIVGEIGTGKSTLLEAIAVGCRFNPEGGSRNFHFATRPSHSPLSRYLRIARGLSRPRDGYFFRAESYFNVATEIERLDEGAGGPPVIDAYGGRSLHEQSHGESLFALVMNRFKGCGLYILDEPESALSPLRQMSLLKRIHDLVAAKSQFVIATHSPILLAYPESFIYACTSQGLERCEYEATPHYRVMHDFITNPKRMLENLLTEDDPPEERK